MKVHVWGKAGCAKCKALLGRLERILPELEGFELEYHDIKTERGMAEFCRHGSINGNTIPAMTVETDVLPPDKEECIWPGCLPLYGEFGLCTDYANGGVIRPEAIRWLLGKARG